MPSPQIFQHLNSSTPQSTTPVSETYNSSTPLTTTTTSLPTIMENVPVNANPSNGHVSPAVVNGLGGVQIGVRKQSLTYTTMILQQQVALQQQQQQQEHPQQQIPASSTVSLGSPIGSSKILPSKTSNSSLNQQQQQWTQMMSSTQSSHGGTPSPTPSLQLAYEGPPDLDLIRRQRSGEYITWAGEYITHKFPFYFLNKQETWVGFLDFITFVCC
jgi:hypothetical protein